MWYSGWEIIVAIILMFVWVFLKAKYGKYRAHFLSRRSGGLSIF
jgi:hypothetical protein